MQVSIDTNALELKNFLNNVARQQLPFALSKTVNALAFEARKVEQMKLDDYFEIRTNWLKKKGGMPVIASSKNQFPDIHAILGVKDEIAALNATGGVRPGRSAVPLSDDVSGIGVSTREQLNPSKRTLGPGKFPSRIVKKGPRRTSRRKLKPKPFYATTGSGTKGVFIRTGGGNRKMKALYLFKDRVVINKTWPLIANVESFVGRYYGQQFAMEFDKALKTAK